MILFVWLIKVNCYDNLINKNVIICLEVVGDCDLKGVDYSFFKLYYVRELLIYIKIYRRF